MTETTFDLPPMVTTYGLDPPDEIKALAINLGRPDPFVATRTFAHPSRFYAMQAFVVCQRVADAEYRVVTMIPGHERLAELSGVLSGPLASLGLYDLDHREPIEPFSFRTHTFRVTWNGPAVVNGHELAFSFHHDPAHYSLMEERQRESRR